MKKTALFTVFIAMFVSGCAIKTTTTDLKIDGTKIDFQKLDSYKKGESCVTEGFFGRSGSNSIADAAKAGSITTILYVEHKTDSDTKSNCTIVYGE